MSGEKSPRKKPSPTVVRRLLAYDPVTGLLTWKVKRGCRSAGAAAGTVDAKGYVNIQIGRVGFKAHILAWVIMTGEWPQHEIDHRDLAKGNNIWENLRPATQAQQVQNRPVRADSLTGLKGVQRRRHRWIARITVDGQRIYLGRFDDKEAAAAAYAEAATKHFGQYARAA